MRIRPNRAEAMALAALVLAMGGSGYAAVGHLGRNTVGGAAIQRYAVGASKIADGAVGTRALHVASVDATKIADLAVQARHLAPASVGAIAIAPGNVTADRLSADVRAALAAPQLTTQTRSDSSAVAANTPGELSVACLSGWRLVGGGFSVPKGVTVQTSAPGGTLTTPRWVVEVVGGAKTETIYAYARCLSITR